MMDAVYKYEHLSNKDINRYSRQLILPEIGVQGQLKLKNSSVLVVGCGGLGCPVAIYLAGTGIGQLDLMDYDTIELSNLHRQVLHTEERIGFFKAESLAETCRRLNSDVKCFAYSCLLNSQNAMDIIRKYDVIVDATDNIVTRYLLNDACVLTDKALVSGSALKFEGQLTVYNYKGSPCYRCLYPLPIDSHLITNCSDGGVIGPVVGVIGSLQALEVIKIVTGLSPSYANKLYIFDGLDGMTRSVKLRGKQKDCRVCGNNPDIVSLIDYEVFCNSKATDKNDALNLLNEGERISVKEYKDIVDSNEKHILIDVRQPIELQICKLDLVTHNIPIQDFYKAKTFETLQRDVELSKCPVFIICRRGNDSQIAVKKIQENLSLDESLVVKDVIGGLNSWSEIIDDGFPIY